MTTSTTALLSEEDTLLVLDCSIDFLQKTVQSGRLEVVHINGQHFFVLDQMLDVKREMIALYDDFSNDHISAERASEVTPAYF